MRRRLLKHFIDMLEEYAWLLNQTAKLLRSIDSHERREGDRGSDPGAGSMA